jgi:hypothetical protein
MSLRVAYAPVLDQILGVDVKRVGLGLGELRPAGEGMVMLRVVGGCLDRIRPLWVGFVDFFML